MKKNNIYSNIVVLIFLIAILSCKNEKKLIDRSDYKEIMKLHDVAMAEMGNIHKATKELNLLKNKVDSIKMDSINVIISMLQDADDNMMDWMAQFKVPIDEPNRTVFLEKQLPLVKDVNESIFTAIHLSEEILNSIENEN